LTHFTVSKIGNNIPVWAAWEHYPHTTFWPRGRSPLWSLCLCNQPIRSPGHSL